MQEETYYSDGTNWVTNQRLIFGDAQHPLGDAINAEMKAEYPRKIALARIAIILVLVILFGLTIFLSQLSDDPLFAPIIAAANAIAIVAALGVSAYSLLTDFRKRPSFRQAMLNIAIFVLLVALILLWFSFPARSLSLMPFWIISYSAGLSLWRILNRHGIFRLCLVERTRTVDVFSSSDRQYVENMTKYVQFALIRRTKSVQSDVKSLA